MFRGHFLLIQNVTIRLEIKVNWFFTKFYFIWNISLYNTISNYKYFQNENDILFQIKIS